MVLGVIVSPLFFSIFLLDAFEPAKASAIRWLAIALVPALAIRLVQRWWRPDPERPGAPAWWFGLLAAFLGVVALSTVLSPVPSIGVWGSTPRFFGALTIAALVVFGAAASEIDRAVWMPRVTQAAIVASLPVTLYGLLQWRGKDPLPTEAMISSFLGNANWIGGWLVMSIPLTCAALVAAWVRGGSLGRRLVHCGVLGALVVFQLAGVATIQARGAALGIAAALFFFGLFLAVIARRRLWAWMLGGMLGLGTIVTALAIAWLGRHGDVTILQRIVIWEAAARLAGADVARLATGYGPDTFGLVIGRVYPEDPKSLEVLTGTYWDRAHAALLDGPLTVGVIGTLLFLAVTAVATSAGLAQLGIIDTRAGRRGALVASAGGGVVGALSALLLLGSPGLAFPAFGAGLLGGFAVFLLVHTDRRTRGPATGLHEVPPSQLMIAALVAAILGHFAESQVGFELVSSGTPFWVYAGLVLAREPRSPKERVEARRKAHGLESPTSPWRAGALAGLVIGVVVATAAVSLLASVARFGDWRILGLLGATLTFGVLIAGLEAAPAHGPARLEPPAERRGAGIRRLLATSGASVAWSGLFLLVLVFARQTRPVPSPVPFFAFLTASLVALAVAQGGLAASARAWRAAAGAWLVLIALEVAALWPGQRLAVAPMQADTSARLARALLDKEQLDRAIPLIRHAVRLAPWSDHYTGMLAGAYLDRAKRTPRPEPWLRASESLLFEAIRRNPLAPRYPLGLSALYVLWADLAPARRAQRLAEAHRHALAALASDPVRSRADVERQIAAVLLRQGVGKDAAAVEAARVVAEAKRSRR